MISKLNWELIITYNVILLTNILFLCNVLNTGQKERDLFKQTETIESYEKRIFDLNFMLLKKDSIMLEERVRRNSPTD